MPAKKYTKRVPIAQPSITPLVEVEQPVPSPTSVASSIQPESSLPETSTDPTFEKRFNKYIERTEKGIDKLTERQALSGQEFR